MKTKIEIINDLFGETCESFTKNDIIKAMNIFANQFKWVKTTCGKNIEFDNLDYEVLRQQAVFFDSNRKIVMALWFSEKGKRTVAPVAKLLIGAEGKSIIHYKDKNPLNLRRDNIDLINHQTAIFKKKKQSGTSSIYKGVSWNKFAKKWAASIKINYKKKHLGYFKNEDDAALEYNNAAIKYFGKEYSQLNILPNSNTL